jgi:hypothetical protein
MSNCYSGRKQKKKCISAEKRAHEYRFYFFNFSGRLIEDAKEYAESNASSRLRISRAFYFLDKAMNKIQQRRPKLQDKDLQRIVDIGTTLLQCPPHVVGECNVKFRSRRFERKNKKGTAKVHGNGDNWRGLS